METNYLESIITQDYTISVARQNDVVEALYITKVILTDFIQKAILHKDLFTNMFQVLTQEAENKSLYIIRKKDICLGIITCGGKIPEVLHEVNWENKENNGFYISRICVHPRWRNLGIGSFLLSWAEEQARIKGFHSIKMDVTSNLTEGNLLIMKHNYKFAGNIFLDTQKSPINCYEKSI
jgi:GNAT superfamily N-acetyltransferase